MVVFITLCITSTLSLFVVAKPYSNFQRIIPRAHSCSVTGQIANCSGIGISYIPSLPLDVTTILYDHNPVYHLSQTTFMYVKRLKIIHLDVSYSDINDIDRDVFDELPSLTSLNLSGNHLSNFSLFGTVNITTLDISGNSFRKIDGNGFPSMFRKLNTLIANGNRIRTIPFQSLPRNITVLSVRGNELIDLNLSCGSGVNYSLESLDVSKNFLTSLSEFQHHGHCFPNLSSLFLDYLPLRKIPNNTFSKFTSLKRLSMDFIGRLRNIYPKAFESSSLEIILVGSAKSFQVSNDSMNLFQNTTLLTNLTTIQLKFPINHPTYLKQFISPLKNLRNLTLKFADIGSLPERFLDHTPNLTSLTLVGNVFSKWDNNIFPSSKSLRYIDFGFNHITDIDENSFPTDVWNNLLMLDLTKNPFVCSCSLYWFRRVWIPANYKTLRQYPNKYYCESPKNMKSRQVNEYNPSAASCLDPLVVMAIVLSVCLFVITFIGIWLYRYRWHIKYYMYVCCARKGYRKISEEDNFHFDAFVSYNSGDCTWVMTKLMPFLEKQQKFRLCLNDRDFDLGKLIADNIVDNMHKSRKLILILSKSFTSDEWCQFELLMAQSRFLREGSNAVILVMLERVALHQMSGPLGILLQNKSAIEWTNDPVGRNLFWNELLNSIN